MNNTEIYWLLFTDTIYANLAFNVAREIIIAAMQVFGNYSSYMMITVANTAYLIALMINYLLGKIGYKILAPYEQVPHQTSPNQLKDSSFLTPKKVVYSLRQTVLNNNFYTCLLLMLSAIPVIGKFIIVLSGFWQLRFSLLLAVGSIAKCLYYIYVVLL